MNHDEPLFEEFLAARLKDKGLSLKRLAEATGITPTHLENLLHGNLEDMPSAPYFRGYLIRIGKVLDFDGEEWWERIKSDGLVRNSGPADELPRNRFIKTSLSKTVWAGIVAGAVILIYLVFAFPRITGKPIITITYPPKNPFTIGLSTLTIAGTVENADSLYLNGGEIVIAPDGSWQKGVLLQNGLNTFQISARKFLGGETAVVEQVLLETAGVEPAHSTSGQLFPTIHSAPEVPATGTFFN